jgi:hypothetical protein
MALPTGLSRLNILTIFSAEGQRAPIRVVGPNRRPFSVFKAVGAVVHDFVLDALHHRAGLHQPGVRIFYVPIARLEVFYYF